MWFPTSILILIHGGGGGSGRAGGGVVCHHECVPPGECGRAVQASRTELMSAGPYSIYIRTGLCIYKDRRKPYSTLLSGRASKYSEAHIFFFNLTEKVFDAIIVELDEFKLLVTIYLVEKLV